MYEKAGKTTGSIPQAERRLENEMQTDGRMATKTWKNAVKTRDVELSRRGPQGRDGSTVTSVMCDASQKCAVIRPKNFAV